jgi:ketosteroid isomerase-like protein
MIVCPLIRSVGLKAATASSRVATLPMFVRSRPSHPPDSPIAGVFHGHDGVRKWQRLTDEVFAEMHFWPEDLIEAPDGRVLALCNARVRGRGSEVVVEVPFAHVIEVRDGKAVAFAMYSQVADARAAVGLPA